MPTSPHEEQARQRKAARLVAAIRRHLVLGGAEHVTARDVADLADAMPEAMWKTIADLAGVRTPSAATIVAAKAYAKAEADGADRVDTAAILRRAAAFGGPEVTL